MRKDVICAAISSFILVLLVTSGAVQGVVVDRVLATAGGEIITYSEYLRFAKGLNGKAGDEFDQSLLKKLIEEKILIQEAKRKGLDVSDEEAGKMIEEFKSQNGLSQEDLENFLKEEGLNLKSYQQVVKEKALVSKLISDDVDSKVIVREKEMADYYQNNMKQFLGSSEKVEVKAIFLRLREDASVTEITDLKRRALRIVALLNDGYNFDSLVDEYSDEPLRSQGGMLGKFAKGGLIPPLDSKAFSMKEGEISDPIWVREGAYILKIVNRSGETFKTFAEAKEEIYNHLYSQKRERMYNEWIKALWEKSLITIN